jgi:dephospho-CoA kinase
MTIDKKYHKEHPIIVGLAGKAASGKTSVAENISPKASINNIGDSIIWDHLFFTLPLYEIASIKKTSLGFRQRDRQLFSMHQVLFDLFGNNALGSIPDYVHFVDLVQQLYSLPIEPEGTKPRSFLQKAGDLCRAYDHDVFAKWVIYKSCKIHRKIISLDDYQENPKPVAIIISDVRFENEAKKILNQPNGIVLYFNASDETRNNRMMKRDGSLMTVEQSKHRSELECDLVKSICSAIIETDNMSVEDQTNETLKIVKNFIQNNA